MRSQALKDLVKLKERLMKTVKEKRKGSKEAELMLLISTGKVRKGAQDP